MNELELFSYEEPAKQETVMTTAELADALNVTPRVIQKALVKLANVHSRVSKNRQGGYLFTQAQAVAIKKEIQKHHNLKSRAIDEVKSELEIIGGARQALSDLAKLYGLVLKRSLYSV